LISDFDLFVQPGAPASAGLFLQALPAKASFIMSGDSIAQSDPIANTGIKPPELISDIGHQALKSPGEWFQSPTKPQIAAACAGDSPGD
jgi:hypothetical protein